MGMIIRAKRLDVSRKQRNTRLNQIQYGIKKILIGKIAEKLFESKMIEFTQQEQVTEDAVMFRARIHVVPDTQVRIIRELKDAGKTT